MCKYFFSYSIISKLLVKKAKLKFFRAPDCVKKNIISTASSLEYAPSICNIFGSIDRE